MIRGWSSSALNKTNGNQLHTCVPLHVSPFTLSTVPKVPYFFM